MIQVGGVHRQVVHNGCDMQWVKDEVTGELVLVITYPDASEAHCFPLPPEVAEAMERDLHEKRTKVAIIPANGMPAGEAG